jgi:hypothetical protein
MDVGIDHLTTDEESDGRMTVLSIMVKVLSLLFEIRWSTLPIAAVNYVQDTPVQPEDGFYDGVVYIGSPNLIRRVSPLWEFSLHRIQASRRYRSI